MVSTRNGFTFCRLARRKHMSCRATKPLRPRCWGQRRDNATRTSNLCEYFEKHYREGGDFCHSDYMIFGDAEDWTWIHKPTEIQVWRDAIDLTSGKGGQVFFHYTSELAFRNITHPSKEATEIWASLRTDGPNANAWWGKGIYTVPLPPDQWQNREQLLDNNFRNMMQRDQDSEDPKKGPAFVAREYPKRAAVCVPILIDPVNAYDVSIRATPEMEAAGKGLGRNLANELLNEPGKPPRCCVVLRVSGEDGVHHARGQLLDTLRQRVRLTPADLDAKRRLAIALRRRGFNQEALFLVQNMVSFCQSTHGCESVETLTCRSTLANILKDMGHYCEAEKLHRQILHAKLGTLGPEDPETISSMGNLAATLNLDNREAEGVELYRQVLSLREKRLGPSHRDTLNSVTYLAAALRYIGNLREALELHRRALDGKEKMFGPQHPVTLQSVSHLAVALQARGDLSEALVLQRRALETRERLLGPQHPSTRKSLHRFESVLFEMINKEEPPGEIVEMCRKLVAARAKMLGPQDPDTLHAMGALGISLTVSRNYSEAVGWHRRVLEFREKTLEVDNPSALRTATVLAFTLAQQGMADLSRASEACEKREALQAS